MSKTRLILPAILALVLLVGNSTISDFQMGGAARAQEATATPGEPQMEFDASGQASEFGMGEDIDFGMEEFEDFGDANYMENPAITQEDLGAASAVALAIGAVCAGIPALILGLIIGLLIGRRRK